MMLAYPDLLLQGWAPVLDFQTSGHHVTKSVARIRHLSEDSPDKVNTLVVLLINNILLWRYLLSWFSSTEELSSFEVTEEFNSPFIHSSTAPRLVKYYLTVAMVRMVTHISHSYVLWNEQDRHCLCICLQTVYISRWLMKGKSQRGIDPGFIIDTEHYQFHKAPTSKVCI